MVRGGEKIPFSYLERLFALERVTKERFSILLLPSMRPERHSHHGAARLTDAQNQSFQTSRVSIRFCWRREEES